MPSAPFDSAQFLRQLLAGGAQANAAARTLVRHYGHRLKRRFWLSTGNEDDANDLVGGTLLKVVTHAHTVRSPEAFHTWLMTVADNELHAHHRKNRADDLGVRHDAGSQGGDSEDELPSPVDLVLDSGQSDPMLRLCLSRQLDLFREKEPHRYACIAALVHGDDSREIAHALGRTYAAARQFISQCCGMLLNNYLNVCLDDSQLRHLRRGSAKVG